SGANVNFDRLRHISERAEIGEAREALFAVTIPEKKGSFRKFCRILGNRSVTEFNYRYSDLADAQIFVGVGLTDGDAERSLILKTLRKNGYTVRDLTENDMAKLHIRHMVGGHPPSIGDERVYRFEFPERPGALMNFLTHIGESWNISLFHHRNHGSAYGRVLCGVQVPAADEEAFQSFLDTLDYSSFAETNNPAYRTFLN
ncbi:MAG: threonine ammonia-lyase, biosynthetic, partial [Pseudomonadota bacterium]|nr:threonine ammonia-lyase, biosynthetic [Pseudomonadota bacterium]